MLTAALKKTIYVLVSLVLTATFLFAAFAEAPEATVLPTENEPGQTAEPTPGEIDDPAPYNVTDRLSCVPGRYEEIDLTAGWEELTDSETGETIGFSRAFIVEKLDTSLKNRGIYFLKIANFESAYRLFANGEEIPANTFEYRLDDFVREGVNEIVIEAEKITGEISVVYTPPVVLEGISVTTNLADGTVTVDVSVRNMTDESYAGTVEVSVYELGKMVDGKGAVHTGVASAEMSFDAVAGTTCLVSPKTVKLRDFDDGRKWSPDNPFMYEVTARLGENSISRTFKICEITVDPESGYLTVNGTPVFVNALCLAEKTLDTTIDEGAFFKAAKAEKVNMIISDGATVPQSWYKTADECGIMVYELKNLPFETAFYDGTLLKPDSPTLCIADENVTEHVVDSIRASRKFCGIAFYDTEQCEKYCTDLGMSVDFTRLEGGRGESLTVGVSVINDKNVDMTTATAVLEIKSGNQVLKTETKEYESLKKLGTTGRDVMTREFSFTLPETLKDGTEVLLTVTVDYEGEKTVRTKVLTVEGGTAYEAPYSRFAVIITLSAFVAVLGGAILVAAYRYRQQTEKSR